MACGMGLAALRRGVGTRLAPGWYPAGTRL